MKQLSLVVLIILGGCAIEQRIGQAAKTIVDNYCVSTPEERALIRLKADRATKPNTVRVTCAGDE